MSKENTDCLKQNDQVNPDAANSIQHQDASLGGSGSTHGSFSAIEDDEPVVRYFEHTTLCQVCDLLGLPHPKEYSQEINICIYVDSSRGENDKAYMTENCGYYSAVSADGKDVDTFACK